MLKTNVDHYTDVSGGYDKQRTGKYFALINKLEVETMIPYIRGKKVLEVGCGTGLIMEEVKKYASELKGIDITEGMLNVARQRKLDVVNASATKIPFPDNYFDAVYSFKTLSHIKDIESALKEMVRVTKPGGKLYLEFYNRYSFKRLSNLVMKPKNFTRYDTIGSIKKIAPKNVSYEYHRGIRSVLICKQILNLPVISKVARSLEARLSWGPVGKFGGYLVIVFTKKSH